MMNRWFLSQHPVIAWWLRYNPLTQKPKALEPFKLWHWYSYYGPDPSAGVSYGQFVDEDSGTIVLSEAKTVIYSPVSGKAMKMVGEIPYEELEAALSEAKSSCESMSVECTACRASHKVMATENPVFCVGCGSKTLKIGSDTATAKERKIMTKDERIAAMKARIRAKVALAKKSKTLEEKAYAKILARKKALADSADGDGDEGFVPLDDIVDEVNKAQDEEGDEGKKDKKDKKEAKADPLEGFSPLIGGGGGAAKGAAGDDEEETEEPAEEPAAEDEGGDEPAEDEGGDEPAADAAPAPGSEEEFMDLDMVLSIARKKDALRNLKRARVKAKIRKLAAARKAAAAAPVAPAATKDQARAKLKERIRAKILARRKAAGIDLGSVGADNEVGVKEVPNKPAEESPMPTPKTGKPAEPTSPTNSLPVPVSDGEGGGAAAPAPGAAEAVKFEPLASLDSVKAAKKDEIDMALFGEDSENPTWNISVAGIPACRIELKDQAASEEIRKVFCSDAYAHELLEHCDKSGFLDTMQKVNAKFWANEYSNSKALAKIRTEVNAGAQVERKKYLASYQNEFLNCLSVATSGMNKNFYPGGNPLKEQFFSAMVTVGLPEETAKSVIESSFANASPMYFKTLFEKATEYLNLAPETRREIAQAITSSPTLNHTDLADCAPATLADRVAQASIPAQLAPSSPLAVRGSTMDSDSYKESLRQSWRQTRR